jgi:hypothetical protein
MQISESQRALLFDKHDNSHQPRVEGQIRRSGFDNRCCPISGDRVFNAVDFVILNWTR